MRLIEDGTYIVDVSGADLDKIKRVMLEAGTCCTMMYPDEGWEKGEWIPCGERLPKKGEAVLITNKKGNVKHGQYRGIYSRDREDWWLWKKNTIEDVVAWMPLPEPYKGEVKNE